MLDPMTAHYNLTQFVNSTSLGTLFQHSNTLLGGFYIGYLIIFCLWIVTFIAIRKSGFATRNAVVGSSFLVMIISVLLRAMLMLDNYSTFWVIMLFIIVFFVNALLKDT